MAAIQAAQRSQHFSVPEGVILRDCDLPYWRSAIACRDDWKVAKLYMVAHLERNIAGAECLDSDIVVFVGGPAYDLKLSALGTNRLFDFRML